MTTASREARSAGHLVLGILYVLLYIDAVKAIAVCPLGGSNKYWVWRQREGQRQFLISVLVPIVFLLFPIRLLRSRARHPKHGHSHSLLRERLSVSIRNVHLSTRCDKHDKQYARMWFRDAGGTINLTRESSTNFDWSLPDNCYGIKFPIWQMRKP